MELSFFIAAHMVLGFVAKTVDNTPVFWVNSLYTESKLSAFPLFDPKQADSGTRGQERYRQDRGFKLPKGIFQTIKCHAHQQKLREGGRKAGLSKLCSFPKKHLQVQNPCFPEVARHLPADGK